MLIIRTERQYILRKNKVPLQISAYRLESGRGRPLLPSFIILSIHTKTPCSLLFSLVFFFGIFDNMAPSPTNKDISTSSHVEEEHIEGLGEIKVPTSDLKLDSNGLPLEPQPSDHKDDPLVRSSLESGKQKSYSL